MHYFFKLAPLFVVALLISCVDNKEQAEDKGQKEVESNVVVEQERDNIRVGYGNVYQTVDDNESLNLLKDALRATDLDSLLGMEGPYTLFAPSDRAFEALDPSGESNLPAELDEEQLRQVLLNHVVEGSYRAADLSDGQTLTTLGGGELQVVQLDGELTIDSVAIVFADREADNGYVHIIDSVLMYN